MKTKFNVNQTGGLEVSLLSTEQVQACSECAKLKARGCFSGKLAETYFIPEFSGSKQKLLAGFGEPEKLTIDDYRLLAFNIGKCAHQHKLTEISLKLDKPKHLCLGRITQAVAEGFWRADHAFDEYFTDKEVDPELTVNLQVPSDKLERVEANLAEMHDVMEGIELTQELANQPAIVMYPERVCEIAKEKLAPLGVKIEIFDKAACEQLGMHAFLAVASGSDREPRFLVMTYEGNPASNERLGLVGKGICYDAGGYSIKSTEGMSTMFDDMTGGATVIGAIYALAKRKAKVNVVAATALCENMLSGSSYKPGDIVRSMAGKTIEIANTDAEGRVTLADAVYYVTSRCNVTKIVDIATLTGACLVALGEEFTGVVTDSDDFYKDLENASSKADEKIWRLPVSERFKAMNKSKRADIKNVAGRLGGTVTAGLFVREFLAKDMPWLHLDIAGTAYLHEASGYLPIFATGTIVKTFYNLAKQQEACSSACER
ncbi:leucyl aminopeptidase [Amygdalobacter nucleatus]|uniref:Probable cytosol aminopeptidase n=1 Tax=Amygdalobacter nucleatus TaxID=3029274 RepID=A0A133YHJ0_9FIRM|nr:leucyl aminopeptidase [Amygdalobacter nucleatus]KXB42665.1 cytosol aminopeptidase family, catalytic domain protein [Amygdalobacter nucleatus]MDF0486268.1 leucyl aminopeptidase [Amygdalobacter nucleatus]WEG37175.1 leucyl aminopeptidase [Amygdalobacter nucleatus]